MTRWLPIEPSAASAPRSCHNCVVARGMKSLRDDGMRWAAAGVISLEEAVRVTRE